jgi:TPR repeat protein
MAKPILHLLIVLMLTFGAAGNLHAQSLEDGLAAAKRGEYAKALEIMRPLAEQGSALAQGYIGIMYRDGRGISQNDKEAVRWFRLAAEGGEMLSRTNLAVMYLNGRGVAQDYREALKWLLLAAEQETRLLIRY